jgi:rod shape-determining protein MreC
VITSTSSSLPPAAQADAAQAEAAADEESKRAADLLAERLPSVHDDTSGEAATTNGANGKPATGAAAGTDQIGGVPGVPNSGLPKVQPAVHPDRYTPGATPPAADLRPGAPARPQSPDAGSTPQSKQESTQRPQAQ